MQILLNREAIRARLASRLGHLTGDAQAPLIQESHNNMIMAASLEVAARCDWVNKGRETRVDIGIDQRLVNYPTNSGPGLVQAIGVWVPSEDRYRPLKRRIIGLELNDDPLVDEGEPASVGGRGIPLYYECKRQIELYPRADQPYELKIDYTVQVELTDDGTPSEVDAECIILLALEQAHDAEGEYELGKKDRAKYDERVAKIIRAQSNMPTANMGSSYRTRVNASRPGTYIPNSGQWPSTVDD